MNPSHPFPEPENDTDLLTMQVLSIMDSEDYGFMMERLRERLDAMHKLMPRMEGETAEAHLDRQDSLISLAINRIHEDRHRGLNHLISGEDFDIDFVFAEVTDELKRMNGLEHSARWATLAKNSKPYKGTLPGFSGG